MIDHLDHLVLTTADADACIAFYRRVLGMELETFGNGRYLRDPDLNLIEISERVNRAAEPSIEETSR